MLGPPPQVAFCLGVGGAATRRGTSCFPIAPVAPATNTLIIDSLIEDYLQPARQDGSPGGDAPGTALRNRASGACSSGDGMRRRRDGASPEGGHGRWNLSQVGLWHDGARRAAHGTTVPPGDRRGVSG